MPWLVATSTLEMGIDVGSLNTAINTSVPPLGKLKNFNIVSKFEIEKLDSIDKIMWERFLRLYSLIKLIK